MARGRSTPYNVQLTRHLGQLNGDCVTMSAKTLVESFEHPQAKQRPTTRFSAIHRALHRAWGEGKLISFVDEQGNVLRESEFGAPGSASVEHPQIFATHDTPAPQAGYRPVTYQEYINARGGVGEDEANGQSSTPARKAAEEPAPAPKGEGRARGEGQAPKGTRRAKGEPQAQTDGKRAEKGDPQALSEGQAPGEERAQKGEGQAHDEEQAQSEQQAQKGEEHVQVLRRFAVIHTWEPSSAVPEWIPEPVLCRWVTLAPVVKHWRGGLDRAGPADRLRLVRLGVRRKGDIAADSLTARGLARLVREDLKQWQAVSHFALEGYERSNDMVPAGELQAFAADPVAYYLEGDIHRDAVLLTGLALELDEAALREIADDESEGAPSQPSA